MYYKNRWKTVTTFYIYIEVKIRFHLVVKHTNCLQKIPQSIRILGDFCILLYSSVFFRLPVINMCSFYNLDIFLIYKSSNQVLICS